MTGVETDSGHFEIESNGSSTNFAGCCGRLRADFRLSFFGVTDANNKIIHVQESFAPKPFIRTFLAKILIFGWGLAVLIQDLVETDEARSFYLAYLTHWALCAALAYLCCSLVITLLKEPHQPAETEKPGFFVRFIWGMYPVAAVLEMTATLLYWILQFDPNDGTDYVGVMKHGGVMVLVLVEGLAINRIPVRTKHLLFVMTASALYLLWTGIHALTDIGNPQQNDGEEDGDDDSIYSSLNWNERPGSSAVVAVISVFVLVPLLFIFLWYLSIWSFPCRFDGSNRRYYPQEVSDAERKELAEEEECYP